MSAHRAIQTDALEDAETLDTDTSAAVLRWLETALVPDGIESDQWERWVDAGCRGRIEAAGVAVTPAMLGRWARTGALS